MQRTLTLHTRTTLRREALALMHTEYDRELTLDDVAHRIATSRRQLQRCFNEHGDEGFRRCLARIRMYHAARLLIETSLPVRDVAQRVGYRQPAQFAKAFRRVHGTTPADFRAARTLAVAA